MHAYCNLTHFLHPFMYPPPSIHTCPQARKALAREQALVAQLREQMRASANTDARLVGGAGGGQVRRRSSCYAHPLSQLGSVHAGRQAPPGQIG